MENTLKRYLLFLLFCPALAHSQVTSGGVRYVSSAPSGACTQQPPVQVLNSSGVIYTCANGTWAAQGGSGSGTGLAQASYQAIYQPYLDYAANPAATTLTDRSGNGNTGTFGTGGNAPTWVGGRLQFVGADFSAQYVSIPCAAIAGAAAVQLFSRPFTLAALADGTDAILGSQSGQWFGFLAANWGAPSYEQTTYVTTNSTAFDKMAGDGDFTVITSSGAMYINGQPATGYTGQSGAAITGSGTCYIGTKSTSFGPFNGLIDAVLIYSATPTAAQIQQNSNAVRQQLAGQGIFYKNDLGFAGTADVLIGDSNAINYGLQDILSSSWSYTAQSGLTGDHIIAALQGQQYSVVGASYLAGALSMLQKYQGPNLIVFNEFGGNDISASVTPASLYTLISASATSVHAVNGKIIVRTLTPKTSCTGSCATNLATYNASVLAGARSGTFDGLADMAGVPMLGNAANTTYYPDGQHFSALGNTLASPSVQMAYLEARGQLNVPYWLPVLVTYQALTNASTTQTVNLYNLLAGQQVCGVKSATTTAFAGTGITAMTMVVGDSGGTTNQYLSSQSVLATGKSVNQSPNFLSANGTVQALFTSTGGNLSALTAGSINVDVCVVTTP